MQCLLTACNLCIVLTDGEKCIYNGACKLSSDSSLDNDCMGDEVAPTKGLPTKERKNIWAGCIVAPLYRPLWHWK